MPAERQRALDVASRALARRDHTRQSLERRLARAQVDPAEGAAALDTLSRLGYLDDARYAAGRAELLAGRGHGDEAIRHDLARAGVAREVADEAVAALEPEPERARREAGGLGGGLRAVRTLARRGFAPESIEGLADGFVADGNGVQ
jgi:regulatory protein